MNTILSLVILIRLNSLRVDNNYIIADYIIRHIDEMPEKSIRQLSEDCYVSTTSILKFCGLLGFNSYSEFKHTLVSTLTTRKRQLVAKTRCMEPERLLEYIRLQADETFDMDNFRRQLDDVITEIRKYRVVYLYGACFPLVLASSFVEDMALLGCYVNTVQSNFETQTLKKLPGVHIVVSLSGRFVEINRSGYMQIASMDYPSVLISRIKENTNNTDYVIQLPDTDSSQFDEIGLLALYDYILANM